MGDKIKSIRRSAEGEQCTFRIPYVCDGGTETVVFCHGPSASKGMGNKGHDWFGAYGCASCHKMIDEFMVPNTHEYWLKAVHDTWERLIQKGLITPPPLDQPKKKYTEKVCMPPRRPKGSIKSGKKIPSRKFGT